MASKILVLALLLLSACAVSDGVAFPEELYEEQGEMPGEATANPTWRDDGYVVLFIANADTGARMVLPQGEQVELDIAPGVIVSLAQSQDTQATIVFNGENYTLQERSQQTIEGLRVELVESHASINI